MLSHGNLMAMTEAHWCDIDDPQSDTRLLHAAPMSHGSGLYILPYLARGAAQVIPESGGFDPEELVALCTGDIGAAMFLAPTMVKRLREHCEEADNVPDGLRLIVYGGGPMYLPEIKASLALFGPKLAQIYGQGETPMTISGLDASAHIDAEDSILSSVGRARYGVDIRILGEDGNPVPTGEMGEIACRSATVMKGYWDMPDATADALRGGWLLTGDVGFLDEGGYLTLADRTKDLIISGGSNIYPREVEEVLLSHPLVAEASVVGMPDPEWGEVVVAHIVAAQDEDIAADALDLHCLEHIARFKRPKRYVFHKELPKNAYGKVLKRSLRDTPA
jgi:acyl-CoA synthetase (AMP-forming)/AMP-acid ligase II